MQIGAGVSEESTSGCGLSTSHFSENSDHQKSSTGNDNYQSGSSPGSSGSSGNRLVDMAMSDPELAKKLENPEVMQALNEVSYQPVGRSVVLSQLHYARGLRLAVITWLE